MDKLIGYESEIKQNNIMSIQLNMLNKCTSRCRSCRKYTWPNDMLDIDTIKNVISVLADDYGLKTVVLSGGDPVLYPKLKEVVDFCKSKDIKCSMITTCITTKDEVLKVISDDLYRVHLSLDSINKKQYKYIRGVDAFNFVDKNIKLISAKRKENGLIPIRLSSTISAMNYREVYNLYDYARANNCMINFYLVHTFEDLYMDEEKLSVFRMQLEHICYMEKKYGQISNAKSLLLDMYEQKISGNKHSVDCKCYIPNISCVINANGDVYPCCRLFEDNGEYGSQVQYSYGNIVGKDKEGLRKVFINRLKIHYPISCAKECEECGQRYYDMLQHLAKIKEDKKEVLFV